MSFEEREKLKRLANRVADELWARAKSGALPKIGIDEIRAALRGSPECPRNAIAFDMLEEMTTRRLVKKVG